MKQGDLLYLGKAKSVYLTDKQDELLVMFRDDITAFDWQKKNVLFGKGVCNAKVPAYLYPLLESEGIPTHFLSAVSSNMHLVRKLSMIPLEVIVRNRAAGCPSEWLVWTCMSHALPSLNTIGHADSC